MLLTDDLPFSMEEYVLYWFGNRPAGAAGGSHFFVAMGDFKKPMRH